MRVRTGRRPAVVVAILAATLLIGVVGAAPIQAADPPGLERFMTAVARVESGGNHQAVNKTSGAYGRYQIMPDELAGLGTTLPRQRQRQADAGQPGAGGAGEDAVALPLARQLAPRLVLVAHRVVTDDRLVPGGDELRDPGDGHLRRSRSAAWSPGRTLHRYSERSSTIDYSGTWRPARHGGYAGGGVRYATAAGATATITFTGSRIAWYGPVGPTRGKARVSIDGVAVKTVNLKRSSFDPTTVLYSASWKTSGRHTFSIEVLATPGIAWSRSTSSSSRSSGPPGAASGRR